MAYRISALFRNGEMLFTDAVDRPTPSCGQTVSLALDGRRVSGIVTTVRAYPKKYISDPDEMVDEVDFTEIPDTPESPESSPDTYALGEVIDE